MTREQWLRACAEALEVKILAAHGIAMPEKWHVSVGWPAGSRKAIGQCWPKSAAFDDETVQMFISPVLGGDDMVNLVQVLLHEMIHAAVGNHHRHGGEFKRVARLVGLEGKLTATYVTEGTPLHATLARIVEETGPYFHIQLRQRQRMTGGETPNPKGGDEDGDGEGGEEKKTNTWVRYRSTNEEKYTILCSPKAVTTWGPPKDPWGDDMIPKEKS